MSDDFTPLNLKFDRDKLQQCVNYFCSIKDGDKNIVRVSKLVYLSERLHLRKYFRLISNTPYLIAVAGIIPINVIYCLNFVSDFNPDSLSDSELECLEYITNRCAHWSVDELLEYTSRLPEYIYSKGRFVMGIRPTVDVRDFLNEPLSGVEEFHPLDNTMRSLIIEALSEESDMNDIL